ncbi:hypothetical protein [Sicyoidochytrium minutum DNA virus]|nr:hypothetical protein [Sicyoidochytrium minutum DNA virus]BDC17061.1 hypothetical protein [Sicyoidochytrium minutum DNA virus]
MLGEHAFAICWKEGKEKDAAHQKNAQPTEGKGSIRERNFKRRGKSYHAPRML